MKEWFKTSLGASIVQAEVDKCAQLIPSDYYAGGLQVGMSNVDFLSPSGVVNRYMIENSDHFCKVEDQLPDYHYVVSESDALPFPQKSQDLIILPHTLDFCENPHEVLRQVDQILEPEGCLAITGFNFASFYGAIKLFKRKKNPPWSGHFYSVRRVQDWLSLLGYDLVGAGMMGYLPPLHSEAWRQRMGFLENAGDRWWPGLGGVYVIVGRKKEIAITPSPKTARSWHRLLPGIAQPASQRAAKIGMRLVVKN